MPQGKGISNEARKRITSNTGGRAGTNQNSAAIPYAKQSPKASRAVYAGLEGKPRASVQQRANQAATKKAVTKQINKTSGRKR